MSLEGIQTSKYIFVNNKIYERISQRSLGIYNICMFCLANNNNIIKEKSIHCQHQLDHFFEHL